MQIVPKKGENEAKTIEFGIPNVSYETTFTRISADQLKSKNTFVRADITGKYTNYRQPYFYNPSFDELRDAWIRLPWKCL